MFKFEFGIVSFFVTVDKNGMELG